MPGPKYVSTSSMKSRPVAASSASTSESSPMVLPVIGANPISMPSASSAGDVSKSMNEAFAPMPSPQ